MSELPSGPVNHVRAVSVTGARIMEGTWPNGETHVLISEACPYEPADAQLRIEEGEL